MSTLRHKNGSGKKDASSEACSLSFIDRQSVLLDKTSVWSSAVKSSTIKNSVIKSAVIENSVIENSDISGGRIAESFVSCELVTDFALIERSVVLGNSRIAHTAHLENVRIKNMTVTGDAHLKDWSPGIFDGMECYISHGAWLEPPRILRVGELTVTESVNGFAYCGCQMFDISHWLKIGDRYGKRLGLTVEQVTDIRVFLLSL